MNRTQYQTRIVPPSEFPVPPQPPYQSHYPVPLPDGSYLELPLQPFPDGKKAIALLMSNQTPFELEDALTPLLAELARPYQPEAIAGIPTLGLDYARRLGKALGFPQYVALGNSRKFWYSDDFAVPVVSATSPSAQKSLYIDPGLVERVSGKRTLLVDDVINTGGTAAAAVQLLQKAGAEVVGLVVVLTEGRDWQVELESVLPNFPAKVRGLGHIPLFERIEGGWAPIAETM